MNSLQTTKVPRQLLQEPDPSRPGHFRLVSSKGTVWAEGIPSEGVARLFAKAPLLLLGYSDMFEEVQRHFESRWELEFSDLGLQDFAEDEGPLEELYPGAPEYASWLLELEELIEKLRPTGRESMVEDADEPQLELF